MIDWQKCPVCEGHGYVSYPYGNAAGQSWNSTDCSNKQCHRCGGSGTIQRPPEFLDSLDTTSPILLWKKPEKDSCGHGKQINPDLYAFCLLASGHAGDHSYMDSDGLFYPDEGRSESGSNYSDSITEGVCPTCGTDLDKAAARRSAQRKLMRIRRAAERERNR